MIVFSVKVKVEEMLSGENLLGFLKLLLQNKGKIEVKRLQFQEEKIFAMRCLQEDPPGLKEDVFILNEQSHTLLIQSSRDFASALYMPSLPSSLLSLLIQTNGLQGDGKVEISNRAHELPDDFSEGSLRLPSVMLVRDAEGKLPFDADQMSRLVQGCAHVFIKDAEKEYDGGRVLLYGGKTAKGFSRSFLPASLQEVARAVYALYVSIKQDQIASWEDLTEAEMKREIIKKENEAKQARAECGQFVDTFDRDTKEQKEKLQALQRKLAASQAETANLKAQLKSAGGASILSPGAEKDLYAGEIKDTVLEAIQEVASRTPDGTRKKDILCDILSANPQCGVRQKKRAEVKEILKNSPSALTAQKDLKNFGFELEMAGKHCKLRFKGDDRYKFIMAKTPSDVRSGRNLSQEIVNKLL